ncbi:MAG: cation:proton antiporter [Prevotella sp.]|uniref:cation:proton antiporter n=1 Tax=Prevotella sp. TaxID=59823 RepID=UPI002585CB03|nr:cation:proton antiporter [Prevotella sp.]MDD6854579.1 cation:proton antiporter [Prevotella sp.]
MNNISPLIVDLALILIVAGIVTLVFKRLKQPLVLGYIVAGFIVSPNMPLTMSVVDKADIHTWADIGVMFLLFSLGLDFSIKKILKMGVAPAVAAVTIIFSMVALGGGVGHAFGWTRMDCIFLGGMLAMSSTTIIYKAFNDMGLSQQQFASSVMSVLILEDILAIVMMVMLSAIAGGGALSGGQMLQSIMKIVFFLVLWFVVGLYVVPSFLRAVRKLINDETLLIVALGLCCLMAVVSTRVGFSAAFGAFVMGSILAETIEAERIIKLVEPVKNLFGAIFFVSVGMLVEPKILVDYALPIVVIVMTILIGQAVFGSIGFLLSGQSLKNAMRCGFSMAQIGEFAFIIASLGLSLGVISDFLYPVVVAVSVVTTFLTPYMIRAAIPCYDGIVKVIPHSWLRRLEHRTMGTPETSETKANWKRLIRSMVMNTLIYSILSVAVIAVMFNFALPPLRLLSTSVTGSHWAGNAVCGVLTLLIIAPFLRAIIMKKNHSEEAKALWTENRMNRLPLFFTMIVRIVIASAFVFYIATYLTRFTTGLIFAIVAAVIGYMILSRNIKKRSISLERRFIQNLQSRDVAARVHGDRRPLFEQHLLDRDIHIGMFTIPEDSTWAGKTLKELKFRNRFGIHVSSIIRGVQHINIPTGSSVLFPNDKIQVIGDDEQLANFGKTMKAEINHEDPEIEKHDMKLRQLILSGSSPFIGKTLSESGIRDKYNCMVVGVEEGQEKLTMISPSRKLCKGDILWVVGEPDALKTLESAE